MRGAPAGAQLALTAKGIWMQRAGEQVIGTAPEGITQRLSASLPRYTSYPTAPHFHSGIGAAAFRNWLEEVRQGEEISLYIHIPFCDRLCWFCACHTKMTRRYEPVAAFLEVLKQEVATVGSLVRGARVRALHFGGGSPTILKPEDVIALNTALRDAFDFLEDTEISVELDPSDMDEGRLDAFAAIGMTRASLGVQDFDPKVQKAINREQSFALTQAVVDGIRSRGVRSLNLDLLYGLPHQTMESLESTIGQALLLSPDRIALFGYAHVPWFKKHQTMIDEAALPGPQARLTQQQLASGLIGSAGYQPIGFDHFAKPGDTLAAAAKAGRLRRNFQGYTDDGCETLIGLGPSSVSRFRGGYAQNTPAINVYSNQVENGGLATARGIALSEEDRARAWVIERLMCDFAFSRAEAESRFGEIGCWIIEEAQALTAEQDGLLTRSGDLFQIPADARVLVRAVAARFDAYLDKGNARHSVAV